MALIRCKMCGADLNIQEGSTVCECEYCGSKQTVPSVDNNKALSLFSRANRLRIACEFDKAYSLYENIISDFPEEPEAYWGLVLCKYGIEYVNEASTGEKIPTCHRSSYNSVLNDCDYISALRYADVVRKTQYEKEAKLIEQIRSRIIDISSKESPYDIFICYKESDNTGNRTIDSVLAQDIYDALIEKKYRVFFSRITLEDKLGEEYEPYIFSALNTAKVMLVIGTSYEYFSSPWVKNEWSRFLTIMERGDSKTLIPCYKDIDPYDLPDEFKRLQAQDLGKVGAIQDLLRGINKILPQKEIQADGNKTNQEVTDSASVDQLDYSFNFAISLLEKDIIDQNIYEKTEKIFRQLIDECPWSYKGYYGIFRLLTFSNSNTQSNEIEKNIEYIEHAKDTEQYVLDEIKLYRERLKNNLDDIFQSGINLLNEGKRAKARDVFNKLIAEYPHSYMGYYGMFCSSNANGQSRDLIQKMKNSSDCDSNIIEACEQSLFNAIDNLFTDGMDALNKGDISLATSCFEQIYIIDSRDWRGCYGKLRIAIRDNYLYYDKDIILYVSMILNSKNLPEDVKIFTQDYYNSVREAVKNEVKLMIQDNQKKISESNDRLQEKKSSIKTQMEGFSDNKKKLVHTLKYANLAGKIFTLLIIIIALIIVFLIGKNMLVGWTWDSTKELIANSSNFFDSIWYIIMGIVKLIISLVVVAAIVVALAVGISLLVSSIVEYNNDLESRNDNIDRDIQKLDITLQYSDNIMKRQKKDLIKLNSILKQYDHQLEAERIAPKTLLEIYSYLEKNYGSKFVIDE